MLRCVNIDWLEIFCEECTDTPRDEKYFTSRGYVVHSRAYGTPQYKEMFTIYIDNFPFVEIRRNPYSLKKEGGIFKENDCHLRLSNRECYDKQPIQNLIQFLKIHSYTYKSISRIDICNDFVRFDNNVLPINFCRSYIKGNVSKIGLSRLAAHGTDKFYSRDFNSISWGARDTAVGAKIYNKTQELKEVKDKFYIRDCWSQAGMNENAQVWRVEFSIKSEIKILINEDADFWQYNNLHTYDSRLKLQFIFLSLAKKYFNFKKVTFTRDGKRQRKDRCPDIKYFFMHNEEKAFVPKRLPTEHEPTRTDTILINKLKKMIDDESTPAETKENAKNLISYLIYEKRMIEKNEIAKN